MFKNTIWLSSLFPSPLRGEGLGVRVKKNRIIKILSLICAIFFVVLFKFQTRLGTSQTIIQFTSWGSKSEIEILKPILADFEKKNPDIKVEFIHIPQNIWTDVQS